MPLSEEPLSMHQVPDHSTGIARIVIYYTVIIMSSSVKNMRDDVATNYSYICTSYLNESKWFNAYFTFKQFNNPTR